MGNLLVSLLKNNNLILVLPIFYMIMGYLPEWLDAPYLYYIMDCCLHLMTGLLIYKLINKSVILFCFWLAFILFQIYDVVTFVLHWAFDYSIDGFYMMGLYCFVFLTCVCSVSHHLRFKPSKIKYNKNIPQKIIKQPNSFLTMLRALFKVDGRGSVMYCYNGKMIRYKKGKPYPVVQSVVLPDNYIIENLEMSGAEFEARFTKARKKRFKLFTQNCTHLLD